MVFLRTSYKRDMRVLNFGSLNIDYVYSVEHIVREGETISSLELNTYGGGKGLNQSIALSRAGISVYHAGAIGEDGRFLLELLHDAGVNTKYVRILNDVRTGNAIIQKDRDGNNCILLYGGANQNITKKQIEEVLSEFSKGDILLIQNEINELDYLVNLAHDIGFVVVLNPSPMDEKILKLSLDKIDWFILNEIEASQILKVSETNKITRTKLAEALQDKFYDAKIVLTLGKDGSIYIDKNKIFQQASYKTKVVDTTAAGDTFTGYFIYGMIEQLPVQQALDIASKAAAIAVSGKGAAPSIPKISQVNSWRI